MSERIASIRHKVGYNPDSSQKLVQRVWAGRQVCSKALKTSGANIVSIPGALDFTRLGLRGFKCLGVSVNLSHSGCVLFLPIAQGDKAVTKSATCHTLW